MNFMPQAMPAKTKQYLHKTKPTPKHPDRIEPDGKSLKIKLSKLIRVYLNFVQHIFFRYVNF